LGIARSLKEGTCKAHQSHLVGFFIGCSQSNMATATEHSHRLL